jgi:lycopene beta-cyclase
VTIPAPIHCDIAIAGGGLAGGLIALALAEKRPDLRVIIVEAERRLGGNHVWSFFDSDVAAADRWLVEPLICHRWDGYDIAFPAHARTLDAVYNSIESERLDEEVRARLGDGGIVTGKVADVAPAKTGASAGVVLESGLIITARHVIDARGPGDLSTLQVGWQKFLGQSLTIPGGHGLTRPIVMDASVEQVDGYRFIYCLPFDAETVFVEDTYYSDTPELDLPLVRGRIAQYAAAKGWVSNSNAREETGVLPVVMGGDFEAYWNSTGTRTAKAGLRSGMFHATTGYSLPDAVRMASAIPALVNLAPDAFAAAIKARAAAQWKAGGFYRLLDAMLFRAAEPAKRYKVLERFYRLSPGLIRRFYAGQSTFLDKARILSGKPPVPIGRAIKAILGSR